MLVKTEHLASGLSYPATTSQACTHLPLLYLLVFLLPLLSHSFLITRPSLATLPSSS